MKDQLLPDRFANKLMMMKSHNSFLIVEGRKDELFFSKFRDDSCHIEETHGKENLISTILILNERKFGKALAIRDSDFDKITLKNESIENLLLTDFHDIEISILCSKTLYTILNHIGSRQKIDDFEKKNGKNKLLDFLMNTLENLSKLKLANILFGLGLKFKPKEDEKSLDFGKLFKKETLEALATESMIDLIYQYSSGKSKGLRPKDEVKECFDKIKLEKYDLLHLCNGHDVASLLLLACQKLLGNNSKSDVSIDDIESKLILGFDSLEFKATNLYGRIKDWEKTSKNVILNC